MWLTRNKTQNEERADVDATCMFARQIFMHFQCFFFACADCIAKALQGWRGASLSAGAVHFRYFAEELSMHINYECIRHGRQRIKIRIKPFHDHANEGMFAMFSRYQKVLL
jgi:hypothetical protein